MSKATRRAVVTGKVAEPSVGTSFLVNHTPAIETYIAEVNKKYGKHRLPLEEARMIIDAAMGDRLLSDAVIEDRR